VDAVSLQQNQRQLKNLGQLKPLPMRRTNRNCKEGCALSKAKRQAGVHELHAPAIPEAVFRYRCGSCKCTSNPMCASVENLPNHENVAKNLPANNMTRSAMTDLKMNTVRSLKLASCKLYRMSQGKRAFVKRFIKDTKGMALMLRWIFGFKESVRQVVQINVMK
jgi:hypothetical protein